MESQPSPDAMTRSWDWGDRVATEFEEALRRSERPSIREELERIKPEDRLRVLPELVGLEIIYRRRAGEDVSLTDYEPIMSELRPRSPRPTGPSCSTGSRGRRGMTRHRAPRESAATRSWRLWIKGARPRPSAPCIRVFRHTVVLEARPPPGQSGDARPHHVTKGGCSPRCPRTGTW